MKKLLFATLFLTSNLFAGLVTQQCNSANNKLKLTIIDRADAARFDSDINISDYPADIVDAVITGTHEEEDGEVIELTGILQYGDKKDKGVVLGLGYLILEKTKKRNELTAKIFDTEFDGGFDPSGEVKLGKLLETVVLNCQPL